MRKNYLFPLAMLCCFTASAQQEQMYTQFSFNKIAYNPGYTGSFSSPTLTAVYRQQWIGLDGAPNAQVLTYNQALWNDRVGLGGGISRQQIGINTSLTIDFSYAYRVKTNRGHVCVGLQPSVRNLRQNWADPRIKPLQQNDNSIPTEVKSKFLTNLSAGIYYAAYHNKWYAGIGVHRLIRNNIDLSEYGILAREVQHFNAMGGITYRPNKDLEVTPQALFRYAVGAPIDAELNVSVLLRKKFYGGIAYRVGGDKKQLGESVDVMLGLQATDNLFFCFSYDIGISKLRHYNSGSMEATIRWWFVPPADNIEVEPDRPF
jgi:type IX secretion system PorP/SprF family membrane protein